MDSSENYFLQQKRRETSIVKELIYGHRALETKRKYWEPIWTDVDEQFNVLRENSYNMEGAHQGLEVYDGTPISALNISSDGFHGAMISQAITWVILKLPQKYSFLQDIPEVNKWLQDALSGLYSTFNNSNFYSEMRSFIRDCRSIGTATITIDDDYANNKLVFRTRHPYEGYIAQNHLGQVDTYHRRYKSSARNIALEFGVNNPSYSYELKDAIRNNSHREFELLHAIFPRTDFDSRKASSVNKKYASIHLEYKHAIASTMSNSLHQNGMLRHSGFNMMPSVTWRWFRNSAETYGRSPCMYALVDSGALQAMSKSHLRAGELAADPAYNVPAEQAGKVRVNPHGMNYYGYDPKRVITPVTTGHNYPISIDREDKKREMIEKHLNVDFYLILSRAQQHNMTAEQVREIASEKAIVMSAEIGEFTSAVDQIIDYVFAKEIEHGRIPEPPDVLLEYMDGERIDTDFLGPLAQAQKRLFEREPIRETLETLAPIGEIFPEALDIINPTRTAMKIARSTNYPQDCLNTPDEIRQVREGRRFMQEQETKKLDAERMAAAIKDLAQAKKNAGGDINELAAQLTGEPQAIPA